MFRDNFLKNKLNDGQFVLGTWCVIPSPVTADIISSAGLDFIIIDSEHGPISFETAQIMAMAAESRNVSPVLRVSGVLESDILKALDIGAHCVQIPNIQTKFDVQQIIRYAKYPPEGNRGFSPFTRAGDYSIKNSKSLTKVANQNVLIAINIEGTEAFRQIDDILQTEFLDIVFVGLFDLSKSLGIPGDVENPVVLKHLSELVKKIRAAKKYAGTIATSAENMRFFVDIGLQYIVYLVDCEMLKSSYLQIQRNFDEICRLKHA